MEATMRSRRGRGGILLGPGRSLEDWRQQITPRKVLRHSPPPPRRVRPSLRPLHCRALDCSSRAFSGNMRLPPLYQADRPPRLPHPHGEGPAPLALPEVETPGGAVAANTQKPRPAARPRLQRALPATLRWGAGPDTAALGLGEGRTNARLPATPAGPPSGFAHLGPEPITRACSPDHGSQSDARAQQTAGKPTPPMARAGGRTSEREPLSLTSPPPRRPTAPARLALTPPTRPPHPGGRASRQAAAHSQGCN